MTINTGHHEMGGSRSYRSPGRRADPAVDPEMGPRGLVIQYDGVAGFMGPRPSALADHTGSTGTFDVQVHFVPERRRMDPGLELGQSLEQALQSDVGLKLEKGKGPVEVLVVDHMEKPTEN
ncbi:MAG TPA: TIGR03435 family protein [Verrucomicrobiae bacterium]|nr:TIGR03435 family protein [Verrucomicrobiae bacterium]